MAANYGVMAPAQPLVEELMESKTNAYQGFITNMAHATHFEREYLGLSDVDVPQVHDIPVADQDQREFVREIVDALVNTEGILEADSNHAVRKIKEKKYSDVELEILAWKMLDAMIQAQNGKCEIPEWYMTDGPKYQEFDSFRARFDKIVGLIQMSKDTVKSMFTNSYFPQRLAWNPAHEESRKMVNRHGNQRKNFSNKLGNQAALEKGIEIGNDNVPRDADGNVVELPAGPIVRNKRRRTASKASASPKPASPAPRAVARAPRAAARAPRAAIPAMVRGPAVQPPGGPLSQYGTPLYYFSDAELDQAQVSENINNMFHQQFPNNGQPFVFGGENNQGNFQMGQPGQYNVGNMQMNGHQNAYYPAAQVVQQPDQVNGQQNAPFQVPQYFQQPDQMVDQQNAQYAIPQAVQQPGEVNGQQNSVYPDPEPVQQPGQINDQQNSVYPDPEEAQQPGEFNGQQNSVYPDPQVVQQPGQINDQQNLVHPHPEAVQQPGQWIQQYQDPNQPAQSPAQNEQQVDNDAFMAEAQDPLGDNDLLESWFNFEDAAAQE